MSRAVYSSEHSDVVIADCDDLIDLGVGAQNAGLDVLVTPLQAAHVVEHLLSKPAVRAAYEALQIGEGREAASHAERGRR